MHTTPHRNHVQHAYDEKKEEMKEKRREREEREENAALLTTEPSMQSQQIKHERFHSKQYHCSLLSCSCILFLCSIVVVMFHSDVNTERNEDEEGLTCFCCHCSFV